MAMLAAIIIQDHHILAVAVVEQVVLARVALVVKVDRAVQD
jgi:hypothetical protein